MVNVSATLAEVVDSGTPAVLTALTKGALAEATPAADNLQLLASWAATAERTGDLPIYV